MPHGFRYIKQSCYHIHMESLEKHLVALMIYNTTLKGDCWLQMIQLHLLKNTSKYATFLYEKVTTKFFRSGEYTEMFTCYFKVMRYIRNHAKHSGQVKGCVLPLGKEQAGLCCSQRATFEPARSIYRQEQPCSAFLSKVVYRNPGHTGFDRSISKFKKKRLE